VRRQWSFAACAFALLLVVCPATLAEEGGTGHWTPGLVGYGAGLLPETPGLYFKCLFNVYQGKTTINERTPQGGKERQKLESFSLCETLAVTWVTPVRVLGGQLAMGLYVPFCYEDVSALTNTSAGRSLQESTIFGLADISLSPATLGWVDGTSHYLVTATIYAPNGYYSTRTLAPLGLNYWTLEPCFAYTYFDSGSGWEASAYLGFDLNSPNPVTRYHTGTQAHLDWTVARHMPLGRRRQGESRTTIAPGLGGWIYQQVTPDTGAGATLGPFRGRTFALGPQMQATVHLSNRPLTFELRILKEFLVKNRPEGVSTWVNMATPL